MLRALRLASLVLVGSAALAPVRAQASEGASAQSAALDDDAPIVPEELPPLDDDLLDRLGAVELPPSSPASLFESVVLRGEGRVRFELDDSRDLSPADDLQAGLSLTGRLGLSAPVGPHRATLVLGDGRRIGQDLGTLPLPLVEPAVLGFVYEARFDVDVSGFVVPGQLSLGRMELEVGDGRWVGRAPFDPRGRTFDGLLFVHESDLLAAQAGAFWLGPLLPGDVALPSVLGVLELAHETPWYGLRTYLLGHRDGTPPRVAAPALSLVTLGARGSASALGFTLRLGADGQLPFVDGAALAPAGYGAHLEGALRFGPELSLFALSGTPFVELSAEWTGGDPVLGRRFRAPGPTVHRFLGVLDAAIADNVMSAALAVGLSTSDGFLAMLEARAVALSDPTGPLLDPGGRALIAADPAREERYALTEVDAIVRIPLGGTAFLEAEYGVGFPGAALARAGTPMQRFLLSVAFSLDVER